MNALPGKDCEKKNGLGVHKKSMIIACHLLCFMA